MDVDEEEDECGEEGKEGQIKWENEAFAKSIDGIYFVWTNLSLSINQSINQLICGSLLQDRLPSVDEQLPRLIREYSGMIK